jgi:tetratricopeptide (TPR) repeat protein
LFLALGLAAAALAAILAAPFVGRPSNRHDSPAHTTPARALSPHEPPRTLPAAPAPRSVAQLREESERVAQDLVRRYPQSPAALHLAAGLYADLRQFSRAEEIWTRCIEIAPTHAGPRVGLAMAAMERGDDAQAVVILEQALAADCRTPEVFLELAAGLQKVGRLEDAEAAARAGLEAFPERPDLWVSQGQIQLQRDNLKDAEASLHAALRLWPDSAPAHYALAAVSARLGQRERAEEHRRRFAQLKAEHPLEQERFQVVYDAILRRIVVTLLCNAGGEHQRQNSLREAERLYRRALELDPASADACRWLASLLHRQGRFREAHQAQLRLVEIEPDRVDNHLNLASLSAQLGDAAGAAAAVRAARRLAPDDPRLQNLPP